MTTHLPNFTLEDACKIIKHIAEHNLGELLAKETEILEFLLNENLVQRKINIFEQQEGWKLTELGTQLYLSYAVEKTQLYKLIMQNILIKYEPTQILVQYFWNKKSAHLDQVISVFKHRNIISRNSSHSLINFLALLNSLKIILYKRRLRSIQVLIKPSITTPPDTIYINPEQPFSNIHRIKQVLAECMGYIYWLDKHFVKEGLEWLWEVADENKIREIRIVSLDLGDNNLNKKVRKEYKRLKAELAIRNIALTWATIDSVLVRDIHDRWIIGENKYIVNLPNVNAITSGQRSEIVKSDNYEKIKASFLYYWKKTQEVIA